MVVCFDEVGPVTHEGKATDHGPGATGDRADDAENQTCIAYDLHAQDSPCGGVRASRASSAGILRGDRDAAD